MGFNRKLLNTSIAKNCAPQCPPARTMPSGSTNTGHVLIVNEGIWLITERMLRGRIRTDVFQQSWELLATMVTMSGSLIEISNSSNMDEHRIVNQLILRPAISLGRKRLIGLEGENNMPIPCIVWSPTATRSQVNNAENSVCQDILVWLNLCTYRFQQIERVSPHRC